MAKKVVKKVKKKPPPKTKKPKKDALAGRLLSAIDEMQDLAPGTITEIHDAPQSARGTPWRMATRFIFPHGTTYEDLFVVLRDWSDDKRIKKLIGQDRLSRIQVRYKNKMGRGSHGEYTLAEIGAWELVPDDAAKRVGIQDNRMASLIERYGSDAPTSSEIESVIVWFSPFTGKELRDARKKKDDKN
jgi:hypothetical protein